jgi:glycosyltransferase involved in cell wall biosynthesis
VRLAVVYHMPFFAASDGSLWEAEGSFSRYIEALAAEVDEVVLCVPLARVGSQDGHRLAAANVRLCALPFFDGPIAFFGVVPGVLWTLWRDATRWDAVNLRIPTPAGFLAYLVARLRGVFVLLLIVGDMGDVARTYAGPLWKRLLFAAYAAFDDWTTGLMVRRSLAFANGKALRERYGRLASDIHVTNTSTITSSDIGRSREGELGRPVRLLCVARVDPRKGLNAFPELLRRLEERKLDARVQIVGPTVGRPGDHERSRILREAAELGVSERISFSGQLPLERVLAEYERHDIFVLPTLPGEGIPRVLLEAMAAGMPVVTTSVAGIPTLIRDGYNGLLVPPASPEALAQAVWRVVSDGVLRSALSRAAVETASARTVKQHVGGMLEVLKERLAQATPSRAGL